MTLKDNVSISNMDKVAYDAAQDTSRIKGALSEIDLRLADMPLDVMLSPEFNGIDLSGGQWQRTAIARGLYRCNNFIILDEPTAAIDPIEEARIFKHFQNLAQGKCAVLVTHRIGSAKLANRIVVLDSGKVVDTGTHEELLARPGKYAEMWEAQAGWYSNRVEG